MSVTTVTFALNKHMANLRKLHMLIKLQFQFIADFFLCIFARMFTFHKTAGSIQVQVGSRNVVQPSQEQSHTTHCR